MGDERRESVRERGGARFNRSWGGPVVATASGGKGERSVLSLKRDRLFRGGARAVASRGLYLPVEGYWFSDSLHHTPQAARGQRETNGLGKGERE